MAGAISKGTVASHAKYVRNENDYLDHVYSWDQVVSYPDQLHFILFHIHQRVKVLPATTSHRFEVGWPFFIQRIHIYYVSFAYFVLLETINDRAFASRSRKWNGFQRWKIYHENVRVLESRFSPFLDLATFFFPVFIAEMELCRLYLFFSWSWNFRKN